MTVDVQGCTNALKDRMSEKGHPEHIRSLASMPPRYTVHPEHKKTSYFTVPGFYFLLICIS
jgi:hypothetical protein